MRKQLAWTWIWLWMKENFAWNLYMMMSLMDIWNDYMSNVLYWNCMFSLYLLVLISKSKLYYGRLGNVRPDLQSLAVADAQDTRESENRRKDSRNVTDNCSCTPLDRRNPKACRTKSGTDRLSLQSPEEATSQRDSGPTKPVECPKPD
ncbi:hypothetical protein ASPVEDRAFT_865196 [Aspergillus versicolor CBS 583.65]|uniref:Uncharacterized protein n=1 Tax=Aspergillus versicolor CBS 583.65 TaxID=1036611 RepID=A0A1L9PW13_ASPVE|nr:uncharacterized protein ASPVEDRAFT_865196 [Aspergillus versicolor CBS 583.65]OJJ05708.1 hypothetical protein ASPVEDRAFT_865196 [Aspergillus versicolor CBS 583.65]